VKSKRAVRLKYYEGVRQATLEHIKATEESLRKLKDVKPARMEELVADLQKRHQKLLKRIDRQIEEQKNRDS
jgi:hypothetical protein